MLIYLSLTMAFFLCVVIFVLYKMLIMIYQEKEKDAAKIEKFYKFYLILVHWVELKQNNVDISGYFAKNHYKTVAVYGMKELGHLLIGELKNANIHVAYVIDQQADKIDTNLSIYKPLGKLPPVDVIIVTAPSYFDDIYIDLKKHNNYDVVSIEDLLWSVG